MDKIPMIDEQLPEPQKEFQLKSQGGLLHTIIVILLALLIVLLVSTGVFYFTVKNNINGIGDSLRPNFVSHPIFKHFLPESSEIIDPDDPQYLSEKELLKKYDEYRKKVKELEESLQASNNTIAELMKEVENYSDNEKILAENQSTLERIREEQAELELEKKTIAEMIVNNNRDGFKEYFQKIDKALAEELYSKLLEEDIKVQDKKDLAKPFASMEPQSAASVLTELYKKDKENVADIFEGLKADAGGLIFEYMDPQIAAEITQMLTDRKLDRLGID